MAVALVVISVISGMVALWWQARLTLNAREGVAPGSLWFTPLWVIGSGFALAGCSAAVYLLRPSRRRMMGALAGGMAWGLSFIGQYWMGFSSGWWRSRLPESSDPLGIISAPVFVLGVIVGTVLMLILSAVSRRFGWKAQLLSIVVLALVQPIRDRLWFTKFLPVMTSETGIVPFLSAAAIYGIDLSVGLLVVRWVGGDGNRPADGRNGPLVGTN